MRIAVLTAIAALCAASSAIAQPALTTWTDPTGAFTLDRPAAWPVENMSRGAGPIELVAGTADEECWFSVITRPESASASGQRVVEAFSKPIAPETWLAVARAQRLFSEGEPTLVTSGVDVSKPFPVQTATLTHPEKGTIIAALHARPGLEVHAFCAAYVRGDKTALFTAVAGSFQTMKDAELLLPPPPAPEAATAAQPQAAPPAEEPRRRRR